MKPAPYGTVKKWLDNVAMKWENNKCLLFPFGVNGCGYGVVGSWFNSRTAHRYICIQAHGKPPKKKEAAHSCGNRLCVNKRHLRWASRKENVADTLIHGTAQLGEDNHRAKLTKKDVLAIRASKDSGSKLGRRFGITPQHVNDIKRGKKWAWL